MTDALIYVFGTFLIVLIFALGFILGHRAAKAEPLMPVAPQKHDPPSMDEETRLRIEADEKAFHDCMNYNIESAYKMGDKS